jgi:quercetin dioxygenase-like cupin family protein
MNALTKQFRESIQKVEAGMKEMIAKGEIEDTLPDCTVKHYFTPIDEKYGCCSYAREMTIPKGTLIIGKIHRHEHLNIISKGKVSVSTEFGTKYLEAPCTFISEVGLKRAVIAEEDTIWTTIHLTKGNCEADLADIEEEVIAPSYEALTNNLIEGVKL